MIGVLAGPILSGTPWSTQAIPIRKKLCALGLLVALTAQPVEGSRDESTCSASELRAIELLQSMRLPNSNDADVIALELQGLGPGIVDGLITTIETKRIPQIEDSKLGPLQVVSESQTEAILLALGQFGRDAVQAHWEPRYGGELAETQIPAAILVLGSIGEGRDLEQIFEMVKLDAGELPTREVEASFEAACTRILHRNPDAFDQLESNWPRLQETWMDDLILAIGGVGSARGTALLADIMTWQPAHGRLIASQLRLVGPSNRSRVNDSLALLLQPLLRGQNREDTKSAALGVGVLESLLIFDDLVALLDDERAGISDSAHYSLCMLTNTHLGPDSGTWKYWKQQEDAWWNKHHPGLSSKLASGNVTITQRTLRELVRHPLHRHELATLASNTLLSPHEETRLLTAKVLGELNSRWGVRALATALEDESEAVRSASHQALILIRGLDHGSQTEDWLTSGIP